MSLLVETIKVHDGKLLNISCHNERMIRTLFMIFGLREELILENIIIVPDSAKTGIFKCRVLYDDRSLKTEFLPYSIRKVISLKLVNGNDVCYPYKYLNREKINNLFELRGECDDIIIIKNGMVTDSSYSNFVFRDKNGVWVTPSDYLLPGTKRAYLLKEKLIAEQKISLTDIYKYTEVRLINSMIDIDNCSGIPIQNII